MGRERSRGGPTAAWQTTLRMAAGLALAAVLAGWWVWLRPTSLGGPMTLVAVGGTSMRPTMQSGDLAVVRERDHYARGDIVAFRVRMPGGGGHAYVIHRIVGGEPESGFRTRGDDNDRVDPWRTRRGEIAGELWVRVPGAARLVLLLCDPVTVGGIFASITAFLVVLGNRHKRGSGGQPGNSRPDRPTTAPLERRVP